MTLAQLKKDPRVYEIYSVPGEWFKYENSLNDGYVFDTGYHLEQAATVKELNELVKGIEQEV